MSFLKSESKDFFIIKFNSQNVSLFYKCVCNINFVSSPLFLRGVRVLGANYIALNNSDTVLSLLYNKQKHYIYANDAGGADL